ncbi:MAG: sulfite exporter TauE/SafE family protein [Phycisphaerales bacterium JB043]
MPHRFLTRAAEWFPPVFTAWLSAFYIVWLIIVGTEDLWREALNHWEAAAAMVVGSYVAGSTPLGGGAVGFPALVLLLNEPATIGRGFSLAIQSIGMTSATIFLLARRAPVEWTLLKWTLIGSTLGTPLGAWLVAPRLDDMVIKLIFAVIWASFGIMHLVKLRAIVSAKGISRTSTSFDREIGISVGILGGLAAAIVGVGIDMMAYCVLVLLYRADLKIAIPTSVIAMTYTSLLGTLSHALLGQMDSDIFAYWLAAAPVVAIGAPFGALMVLLIPRTFTLVFVSILCLGQFVWIVEYDSVRGTPLILALAGVLVFNALFALLWRRGTSLSRHAANISTRDPSFH